MILPIFGSRKKSGVIISGISSPDGFALNIGKIFKKQIPLLLGFATRYYSGDKHSKWIEENETNVLRLSLWMRVFFFIFFIGAYGMLINNPHYFHIIFGIVVIVFGFFTMPYIASLWIHHRASALLEWHACEHKSVTLLEENLDPTMQNLKKCPAMLAHCGTIVAFNMIQFFFYLILMLGGLLGIFPFPFAAFLSLYILIASSILLFLYHETSNWFLSRNCIIFGFFMLAMAPALLFPLLIEKFVMLKTPSPEKMQETVEDIRLFILQNKDDWKIFHPDYKR